LPGVFSEIALDIINYSHEKNIPSYDETTNKGLLRHVFIRQGFHSKEIMVCLVVTKASALKFSGLCEILTEKYKDIKSIVMNINSDNTNVILGKKTVTLWGVDKINDTMCGNSISIAPEAFYQINTPQAEKLYSIAKNFAKLNGNEVLLDLYCGAGTIGLSMASEVKKVIGVEIVPQAVDNAKENAKKSNIENAEFICSDAAKAAEKLADDGIKLDIAVMDPPRKGSDSVTLDSVIRMNPAKIVMVSCNPATAARDCAYLCENGYNCEMVQAVDMFPRTTHVECVVLLSRNED
jgi:23S rRNA (uracil1939-C5)-methyltransferase